VTPAPSSIPELLDRARALAGRTIGELGGDLGVAVPDDQRRAKGLVGQMIERALGATAGSRAEPDFVQIGVELKSIPVNRQGRPQESTFVCTIPLSRIPEMDWGQSSLSHKLARVLWVPIESERGLPLPQRRIGYPLFWTPSHAETSLLQDDWEELAGRIGRGDIESITGHIGRCLQVRPKGANSRDRRRAPEADGAWMMTMPRGFYLRASFTESILRRLREEA